MLKRILQRFAPGGRTRDEPKGEALRGVPPVRRRKTYRAESGYTWSYYYEGYRQEETPLPAYAFVFTLRGGSGAEARLFVVIPESTLNHTRSRTGTEVSSREIYALAKMHLFSVLDREESPAPDSRWELDANAATIIWEQLDL